MFPRAADARASHTPPRVRVPPPSRWDTTAYSAPQNTSMQKAGRASPSRLPLREAFPPPSRAHIPQPMNRAGMDHRVRPS